MKAKKPPQTHTAKDSHYARLRRQHRDEKERQADRSPADEGAETIRLYGLHSVKAAIGNPQRNHVGLHTTENAFGRLGLDDPTTLPFPVHMAHPRELDRLVEADAVHQGAVLETHPLPKRTLEEVRDCDLVVVLDQITDPHNVGAIMRTAVAFSAAALITTQRHSPRETGVLAKSASGALEQLDLITVRNLANAIGELSARGFQTVGLDSEGPEILQDTLKGAKTALVLGSEGKGLRQKTRDTVDALARLDMPGAIKSLNVSNAAAIALYCARQSISGAKTGR